MKAIHHLNESELNANMDYMLAAPKKKGELKMIVRRPAENEREILKEGKLSKEFGLEGDNWIHRGSSKTDDGSSHPEMQLNIMNARVIEKLAGDKERWQLAGDQLFIDLDLSDNNLPPGSQLKIGTAIVEVTAIPHNGCKKFTQRYGIDAVKFVNSPEGKKNHFRGINAKVIQEGTITTGDEIIKIS